MNFIKNTGTDLSDEILLQQYKQDGNLDVLASLYQRYMELTYGVCLKYLENKDDAKDAVINIFEELIEKVKKYEITYFKSWLYQLAKNHCLMNLRKKKTLPKHTVISFMESADLWHHDPEENKEQQFSRLQHCLNQLVAQQQQSISLFYLQGKCYKTIAEETGIEIGKIKSYIQNGRRNLKICIEKKITATH